MSEALALIPDTAKLLRGALAFLRIGGIVFALPVFGDSPTPIRVRVMISLAITFGVFPILPANWMPNLNMDIFMIASTVMRELLIGLFLGFVARLTFDGILMAAGVVAYQMGFGTASLFIPDAGTAMDSFSAFHRIIIMLIFFSLNLHQVFFYAMVQSFQMINGGAATLNASLGNVMIELTSGIFIIALQLAAPLVVSMLFTMAALGLVTRAVPQFNVFAMSFPISFTLGIIVYIATFPLFPDFLQNNFEATGENLLLVLRGLKGA